MEEGEGDCEKREGGKREREKSSTCGLMFLCTIAKS